jgi:hypothetical protein
MSSTLSVNCSTIDNTSNQSLPVVTSKGYMAELAREESIDNRQLYTIYLQGSDTPSHRPAYNQGPCYLNAFRPNDHLKKLEMRLKLHYEKDEPDPPTLAPELWHYFRCRPTQRFSNK